MAQLAQSVLNDVLFVHLLFQERLGNVHLVLVRSPTREERLAGHQQQVVGVKPVGSVEAQLVRVVLLSQHPWRGGHVLLGVDVVRVLGVVHGLVLRYRLLVSVVY